MNAPISSPIRNGAVMSSTTSMSSALASTTQQSPSKQAAAPQAPRPAQASNPSTDVFLRDFTLVAEAAKRAQVAVMCRDFESCGL